MQAQRIWAVAQRAFDEKSMHMNAFLSFAHLLAQALVAREESRAAELILKSGMAPHRAVHTHTHTHTHTTHEHTHTHART